MPSIFSPAALRRAGPAARAFAFACATAIVGLAAAAAPAHAATPSKSCGGRPCPKPAAPAARAPEVLSSDDAFVAARNAAARGDPARFEQVATQVGADHPLAAYVEFWRLRMLLAESRASVPDALDARLRGFVARHAGSVVGELARREWLLSLGRRELWGTFDEVLPGLAARDDASIRCLAL